MFWNFPQFPSLSYNTQELIYLFMFETAESHIMPQAGLNLTMVAQASLEQWQSSCLGLTSTWIRGSRPFKYWDYRAPGPSVADYPIEEGKATGAPQLLPHQQPASGAMSNVEWAEPNALKPARVAGLCLQPGIAPMSVLHCWLPEQQT